MRQAGTPEYTATVIDRHLVAEHVVRIRMQATGIFIDAPADATSWLRFWFRDPEGGNEEHQRAYTIIEPDVTDDTFSIDMVLHEPAGPASVWATIAKPGDTIDTTVLGSTFQVPDGDELPDGYLLVGDSASLPAIREIVEALPVGMPIEVYLEQHHEADRELFTIQRERLNLHWVERENPGSLAAALEPRDWTNWRAWIAPESASMKFLRERLKEFGFPKSEITAQAYWIHGRAMGKNRTKEDKANEAQAEAAARATLEAAQPVAATESDAATGWRAAGGARLLKPLKSTFWLAGIIQALITLVQLAPFIVLTEFARAMLQGAGSDRLVSLGLWAAGFMLVGALLAIGLMIWLHVVDAKFETALRQQLLEKLTRVPLGWFNNRGSAGVTQLVRDDTQALHYLITHAASDAVAATVAPLAVLVYLFTVDWRVALALFIPILVYIGAMYLMVIQSGDKASRALAWNEKMIGEASAYLEGQPVVRVFGGGAGSQFRRRVSEFTDFLERWQRPFSGKKTFMDVATRPITALLVICAVGAPLVVAGKMPAVDILPFLFLGAGFGAQLVGIGYGLSGLRDGRAAARRLQTALDSTELTATASAGTTGQPGLSFKDVSFAYRPGQPVLQHVSFDCAPGTLTAIIGPSGAGKSTLANLAARFFDVTDGAVLIDGEDVRTLSADELYRRVGFVFQDPQIVHATIAENIALAKPHATAIDIERAAKAAQIHDRITRLPHGYATEITPDSSLSGGEMQRIAIARAILSDTPVLILDEATAFADPESEYEVQQALRALTKDKTVLVIAHRLHTIADADQTITLRDGQVAA